MMSPYNKFKRYLSNLRRNEEGSIAVETVLMVPLMAWAMLATLTYFDAYRHEAINHRAGLTIADMFSREANAINSDYMDGAHQLFNWLAYEDPNPSLRVTVYYWDAAQNKYQMVWSEARGGFAAYTNSDVAGMSNQLPVAADQERAILVETQAAYDPPWNVGLSPMNMQTKNVISPRFATQLCWTTSSMSPAPASSLTC